MGWQDAPPVDSGSDKPAWMAAPAVDQPKPGPTKEDIQAAMGRRQLYGASPLTGGMMTPDVMMGARQVIDAGAEMLAKLFGDRKTAADTNQTAKDEYEKNYQPQAFPGAGIARGLGGAAILAPLTPAAAGAGVVKSMAAGAGMGGVTAPLTEPAYGVTDDKFWAAKGQQAKEGALSGAVLGGAGAAAGKVLNPTIGADQQALLDQGVRLTPGQAMGGLAKSIEDKMTSFPALGELIKSGQFRGITDFNRAIYSKALAPFGDEGAAVAANADVGNKGIAAVGDFLSSKYQSVLPGISVGVDQPFVQQMGQLAQMTQSLPQTQQGQFISILKQQLVDRGLTSGQQISGETMKLADSELGKIAARYRGALDPDQRALGDAVRQAQENLRDMVGRQNPQAQPVIEAANEGWRTLVQMENAGAMLGAKDGIFTPSQFMNAVKKSDNSVRDRAFSRGEVFNQDFAQAGDRVLPNKVPDSGSAGRAGMGALALEGGRNMLQGMLPIPLTAMAGLGAAAVPYLPGVRDVTLAALTKRPQGMQDAGDLLRQLAPYLGMLGRGL